MVSKDSSEMASVRLHNTLRARITFIVKMYKPIIIIAHWSIVRNIIIGRYIFAHKAVYLMECPLIILLARKKTKVHSWNYQLNVD